MPGFGDIGLGGILENVVEISKLAEIVYSSFKTQLVLYKIKPLIVDV